MSIQLEAMQEMRTLHNHSHVHYVLCTTCTRCQRALLHTAQSAILNNHNLQHGLLCTNAVSDYCFIDAQ
jgi:hypothetical protein